MNRWKAGIFRLLGIRPGEWQRLLLLYSLTFVLTASVVWGQAVGDALFLQQVGVGALPLMFIADALLTALAALVYGAFVDRVSNSRLMVMICVLGSVVLLAAWGSLLQGWAFVYPLLFLWQRILKGIITTHGWTFNADYYDTRTAKRHFPLISSAARTGGILSGLLIFPLTRWFNAEGLVLGWALALLLAACLANYTVRHALPHTAPRLPQKDSTTLLQNMRTGVQFIMDSGFLRLMALTAIFSTLLLYLLEYQSQRILVTLFTSTESLATFYGLLGSLADLLTLPIQMFFLSRLVTWLGVGSTNLIFPGFSALAYGLVSFFPSLGSAAIARIDHSALRSAFRSPVDGLLFNAAPVHIKGRARAFINGLLIPLGSLIAGLTLLAARQGSLSIGVIIAIGSTVSGIYLLLAFLLRREYPRALLRLLEQQDLSSLLELSAPTELGLADNATLQWLANKLETSASSDLTLFIARIISEVGGGEAVPILAKAADTTQDSYVRAMILNLMSEADLDRNAVEAIFTKHLKDPEGQVRQAALAGLEYLMGSENSQFLALAHEHLTDPYIGVTVRAIPALIRSGNSEDQQAGLQILDHLLVDEDANQRLNGAHILGILGELTLASEIAACLVDQDDRVRLEAMHGFVTLFERFHAEEVAPYLDNHIEAMILDPVEQVRQVMISILHEINTPQARQSLVKLLQDPSIAIREAAADCLVDLGKSILPILRETLEQEHGMATQMAISVACRVAPEQYRQHADNTIQLLLNQIECYHSYLITLEPLKKLRSVAVLRAAFLERSQQLFDEMHYLLAALHGQESIDLILKNLKSTDSQIQANAAEALEALTTPQMALHILSILPSMDHSASRIIHENPSEQTTRITPAELLRQLIQDAADPLMSSLTVYALGEIGSQAHEFSILSEKEIIELLLPRLQNAQPEVQVAARSALRLMKSPSDSPREEYPMLSTIERIIFLKEVEFFRSMTVDQLKTLANICEEEGFFKGKVLFNEGDPGGALYVVVRGRVAIEKEGQEKGTTIQVYIYEAGTSFGEVTLFENIPRTAGARAIEETLTLKLRREPLIALVRQNPDLALALINVLNQRLRESNARITELSRARSN